MTGIRYEISNGKESQGFLTALDDYFSLDEIFSVCGIFEMRLKGPNINMKNTTSYFTPKGNRKFRKMIRKIKKMAEEKNLSFIKILKEDIADNEILYQDEYQIVLPVR